jgi:hypothetical protein
MSLSPEELRSSDSEESPQADLGLEMLSAAHVLLSSDRLTDERDLLISTCLEALDSGPANSEELARSCNEIWPAANISVDAIRVSMSEAQELGLVAQQTTLTGEDWALAAQGKNEIDSTREWIEEAMIRLARQIQERSREDFGEVSPELASNWARVVVRLFSGEIARSAASYAGEVERGAAGTIRPMVLDGVAMLRALDTLHLPPGTTDFLKGCLLAAVDETDPFGNELVGQIATSCVLHAIAARRGRASAQAALGSLAGQRIVLDTPILFELLSSDGSEARLTSLITQAVGLGMDVVVPEHVLEEFGDVIQRVTDDHVANLLSGLETGISPWAYAQIVNEKVLELFLDGVRRKRFTNWNDFRRATSALRPQLEASGVKVRPHGNNNRTNVAVLDMHLTEEISATKGGRGAKAIARDAESIEMIWRARRNEPSAESLWPGGWLVSHDRHASPAYRRANKGDREPLVISPAQLATLMTETAPAVDIPDLVRSAASYIRQESMLRIATKYPPAIALTLARTLSGEHTSATDVRVAQLSLGEMLEQTAAGQGPTGERLASELAGRRANRLAAAGKEQVDLVALERARLDAAITRSTTVVSEEHAKRIAAEERADKFERRDKLSRRRSVVVGFVVGIVAVGVILALAGLWAFVVGTGIALVLFVTLSRRWLRDPAETFGILLWAALPEALGLIDIAIRLGLIPTA